MNRIRRLTRNSRRSRQYAAPGVTLVSEKTDRVKLTGEKVAVIASDGSDLELVPTGHHCPSSGWWIGVDIPGDARFISEGSLMPALEGKPALWTYAHNLR